LEPETLQSQSNPTKTRIIAWTKVARLVGSQGIMTSSECKQDMHKHAVIM